MNDEDKERVINIFNIALETLIRVAGLFFVGSISIIALVYGPYIVDPKSDIYGFATLGLVSMYILFYLANWRIKND
jgi:hypothetical protein